MDGGSTEDAGGGSFAVLGGLERWWTNMRIAAWCLAFCGSVLLNATLLVAFIRRPGLRTISNRFVMNLIASNLLAVFVLTGLLITDSCGATSLAYSSTPSFCALSEGATALVTTTSIFSVLLIGVDQYFAVVDPLRYRTRIDKLKCVLLILAVWLIALVFGALASINPQPRSLWRLCGTPRNLDDESRGETELSFEASLVVNGNATESADLEISIRENSDNESYNANVAGILRNSTDPTYYSNGTTYGLVYALVYALLSYLVPFLIIFWIYVSIYTAARNNSERTRRNGSRPILSSGSFSEEGTANGYSHKPDSSVEDFRRIPKISSLSSIDENSEASPSQIMSSPHSRSNEHVNCQHVIDEDVEAGNNGGNSSVIFTVGSSKVDVSKSQDADENDDDAKDSTKSKVPISTLKAKFLLSSSDKKETIKPPEVPTNTTEMVRSKFPEVPDQRRKSSHDLMYEEMMLGCSKHPYEYELDNSSDEEDEGLAGHHDYEEALPLSNTEGYVPTNNGDHHNPHSSTRSISVNFDLGEGEHPNTENTRMLNQNNANHHSNSNSGTPSHPPPIVTITPPNQKTITPAVSLHRVPSTKSTQSYINNLKYRISNGSLFKYREETRAARISALVIVMGFICWTPYIYVLLLRNLPIGESQPLKEDTSDTCPTLDTVALGFLVLATYISPLLFGYRSRRVKRELRKFFCFKRELSYKNNRSLMAKKVLRRRHSGGTILGQLSGESAIDTGRYNIFNCVYGRNRWPKEKVQFVQVPETALAVETCRSSFSSGASTQISSTSTDEC